MSALWFFNSGGSVVDDVGYSHYARSRKYLGDGTYAEEVYVLVHSGIVSDAIFSSPPPVGMLAVDTVNGVFYVRTGTDTWKSVAIT